MLITTEIITPDLPDKGRDINKIYIEHTGGVWLRNHTGRKELELWIDGKFQASWDYDGDGININANIVSNMILLGFNEGKHKRSKEIKQLLES